MRNDLQMLRHTGFLLIHIPIFRLRFYQGPSLPNIYLWDAGQEHSWSIS